MKNPKKVMENLAKHDLYLCLFSNDENDNKMCLKNSKDEIIFSFEIIENITTLVSLKMKIDECQKIVNSCF